LSGAILCAAWLARRMHRALVMPAAALFNTLSLTDFRAMGLGRPVASRADRLQAWLAAKSRTRLVAAERALLDRYSPADRAHVLSLDSLRGTSAGHLARLRSAADQSVDTIVSVGVLAGATDVDLMLAQIQRVLRPGGRLLFVEPVAARAGTRLRRLQGLLDRLWRVVAGIANPPRDLWNDLKAARFDRLVFDHVNLGGLGGLPVPHLVGEAAVQAIARPASTQPRTRGVGAPSLDWRGTAFAFFGR
jgi:SAM-dependent methyltransferase